MNPATRHLEAFEKRLKVEPMELGVQESDIERMEVDKDNRLWAQERSPKKDRIIDKYR